MEGRGQEQGKEMPRSLVYNPPKKDSPSKQRSPPSTVPTLRDTSDHQTVDHLHHHHQHGIDKLGQSSKPRMENQETLLDPVPVASAPPASASFESFRLSGAAHQENPVLPVAQSASSAVMPSTGAVQYKECMRNHAANMAGHIVDGCGEFMPGGEEGSPEFFKCAACECHRNFHRKVIDGERNLYGPSSQFYSIANRSSGSHRAIVSPPTQHPHQTIFQPTPINVHQHQSFSFGISTSPVPSSGQPVMMAFGGRGPEDSSCEDLAIFQAHDLGLQSAQATASKKRFRTKFTQQQKDKMVEFAEKLGWRMQKQDKQEVMQFCNEVGVTRQVFKVWMHNNKQALKKQQM